MRMGIESPFVVHPIYNTAQGAGLIANIKFIWSINKPQYQFLVSAANKLIAANQKAQIYENIFSVLRKTLVCNY